IPDAPIEEIADFAVAANKYGIKQIFLVAQTTDNPRLKKILKHAQGFLYLVSVLGVTGARQKFGNETQEFIRRVRKQTKLPLCVGFGVSTPEQCKAMIKAGADGVIVGSAIVDIIAKNLGKKDMLDKVSDFAKQFEN
ncbi:MAG: tryptophan synthase subunit alpha, partial [Patescibacteria group bacterium]